MKNDGRYLFRSAEIEDIPILSAMERICFPENEANSYEEIAERVKAAPEDFLLAFDQVNRKIAGFLSGIHSGDTVFRDAFFTDASLHEKGAKHCFLLSLEILPEYRGKGIASAIRERYQKREKERKTETIHLTCHIPLVSFYEELGFQHIGPSPSVWGGVSWEDMIYTL